MRNWMDLNGDGEIDGTEMMFAQEMMLETLKMTQMMILRLMPCWQDLMLMS